MAPSDTITPNLWDIARKQLTIKEEACLANAVVDDNTLSQQLLELVQAKQQQCTDRRWKFKRSDGQVVVIRDVFEKVVRWLQKFKEVGDVATQYDPVHAALPWAGVRMVLQIAVHDTEILGAMAEGIETVSRLITRCAIYESIYLTPQAYPLQKTHTLLQDALISLYASVLAWLSDAGVYYAKPTIQRTLKSVVSSGPSLSAILEEERKTSQLAETLRDQVASTTAGAVEALNIGFQSLTKMLLDLEQPLVRVICSLERMEKRTEVAERKQLARWLSKIRHQHIHQKVHRGLIPTTGHWLLRSKEYLEWCESSASSALWLYGIPGCGKTKLASLVVQTHLDRLSGTPNAAPVAYFYCSRDGFGGTQPNTEPLTILTSILKQLALSRTGGGVHHSVWDKYSSLVEDAEEDGLEPTPLSLDECEQLIISITSDCPITIIVDGLDEAEGDVRDLLNAFHHIIDESHNVVKVFISCRDDGKAPVATHLRDVKRISVTSADNAKDVAAFVDKIVKDSVLEKRLLQGRVSPELQQRLRMKLTETSASMFLLAYLQLEQLCDPRFILETDVLLELEALNAPKQLVNILDQMYDRIQNYPSGAKFITRTVLGWLIISGRRLSRFELFDIVSLSYNYGGYGEWSQGNKLCDEDIRNLCRGFLDFRAEHDSLAFSHESVREYVKGLDDFTASNLNSLVLSQCLIYLTIKYKNFDTLEERMQSTFLSTVAEDDHRSEDDAENKAVRDAPSPFRSYAALFWPYHYTEISEIHDRKKADSEIIQFVFGRHGRFLLRWQQDITQTEKLDQQIAEAASNIRFPTEFAVQDAITQSAIFTASLYGVTAILEKLAFEEPEINWEVRNNFGLSGVYLSARNGRDDTLKFLLTRGASANSTTEGYATPIQAAALHGHTSAVALLLEHNADPLAQGSFPSALHAAIDGGHDSTIRFLVSRQSSCFSSDLESLVKAASYIGQHDAVEVLLERYCVSPVYVVEREQSAIGGGNNAAQAALYFDSLSSKKSRLLEMSSVDINEQGGMFGNLMQAASFAGNTPMVRCLLENGADVNSIGCCGSALRAASLGGHDGIVSLLLNWGAILGPDQQNALEACALRDRLSTLCLLIAHLKKTGECIASRPWLNATLRTARSKGHDDIVEYLAASDVALDPTFLENYEDYVEGIRINTYRTLSADNSNSRYPELQLQLISKRIRKKRTCRGDHQEQIQ